MGEDVIVPFLWNSAKNIFVTYDNLGSLKITCEYVRRNGLAGSAFWHDAGDTNEELLVILLYRNEK